MQLKLTLSFARNVWGRSRCCWFPKGKLSFSVTKFVSSHFHKISMHRHRCHIRGSYLLHSVLSAHYCYVDSLQCLDQSSFAHLCDCLGYPEAVIPPLVHS